MTSEAVARVIKLGLQKMVNQVVILLKTSFSFLEMSVHRMKCQILTKSLTNALASTLLLGTALTHQTAEAGSITATSFESKTYINGDITDQIIASRGYPTYQELGRFEDSGLYTNTNELIGHHLSLNDSVYSGSFSSLATAATTATSTSSPYILDLSLGTQASGMMHEPNIGDTSNYKAYAYHDLRFDVEGSFSLALDWDATIVKNTGNGFIEMHLQDLTDSKYIVNRSTFYTGVVSDSLSDVVLQDGHSYRLWLNSEANDLSNTGYSIATSNVNLRLTDLSPTSIVPSPGAMFVGAVGLVGLALRRRSRCERACESHCG